MTHYHALVWIDHREARIFAVGQAEIEGETIRSRDAAKHIHRKADHVGLGKAPVDQGFMQEVAEALKPFKAILIAGPGTARNELAGFLAEHHPAVSKRIWGIEPMDHPSGGQLIAAAREYFRAADRMHG